MTEDGYRQFPTIRIQGMDGAAVCGDEAARQKIRQQIGDKKCVLVAECYPGVDQRELLKMLQPLGLKTAICSDDLALSPAEIDQLVARELTDDPVFGILSTRRLEDFFPRSRLEVARKQVEKISDGIVLIYGVGASLVCRGDILLYVDITRWEIQLRYRAGMSNWHSAVENSTQRQKYKRGYFAEWRWADRVKDKLLSQFDLYLDMTTAGAPTAVSGESYRAALEHVSNQPFRLVPYFDPGVWGGDWMKRKFALPDNGKNYAWSFDGVPEENSLLLDFGDVCVQTPALNLVYWQPQKLLGDRVYARFGKEFPIRFDMLDTINGQNLSLQVHPLTEYIQKNFNMHYTQDESYYILDTQGENPCVYLGIKNGTVPEEMIAALETAQQGGESFCAEDYVNQIPVKKHDHLLIPAGTVHCSGAGTMVLEISATPYIFTFKLWDWGRLDLDGKPRPIHLEHGKANIQWERDTDWVQKNLVNNVAAIFQNQQSIVERTGLHQLEFLDTYRVSTISEVPIRRNGSVHVINLVEGQQGLLVSEDGYFQPFSVNYAETCIIPEAAGAYRLVSPNGELIRVIVACVRA